MIVQIQTTIQTVFGRVDKDGNVVEQVPININVTSLTPEVFQEALKYIHARKAELVAKEMEAVKSSLETK